MIGVLVVLPVLVPLLAAGVVLLVPYRRLRQVAGMAAPAAVLVVAALLVAETRDGGAAVVNMGGWPSGIAIAFAADLLGALMLGTTALVVLAGTGFAIVAGDDDTPAFLPLVLVMSAGVFGAFLAADLFNLFVLIEVMLAPSYALLYLTGGPHRAAAARLYLTVNLLASTLLLAGIGLLYAVTGTVHFGELAGTAAAPGTGSAAVPAAALAGAVVLLALAVKAAVVPVHGWLPRSYPYAPPAVAALFAGLLTKVGVYAIIRIYAVVFAGEARFRWIILVAALVTMVVGVLGAVAEDSMRSLLAFDMVSQVGYVLLGLALFTEAGLSAAIFYLVQYTLVKTALFLCAGAVEETFGSGALSRLGGLAPRQPLLALTFAGAAFSLAGLPPFSGFVAKVVIVQAAAQQERYLAVGVAVLVSLLTLVAMMRLWYGVFWGRPREPAGGRPRADVIARVRPALVVPALTLTVAVTALGLGAEGLLSLTDRAAAGLIDISGYQGEVLP